MKLCVLAASLYILTCSVTAQEINSPVELYSIPLVEEMKLVVNGITTTPDSKAAFTTARGEILILENPAHQSAKHSEFRWLKFAGGLRRPSLIEAIDGKFLVQQHGGKTLVSDSLQDGVADTFEASDAEWAKPSLDHPFKGMAWIDTPRKSEPFAGQYFGGSRTGNFLARQVTVENETGKHHSLIVFKEGLTYPVDAISELKDGSWLIAESNRSTPDRTRTKSALQRLKWKDEPVAFEIVEVKATGSGFTLSFTGKLLANSSNAAWAYGIKSLTDKKDLPVSSVEVQEDQRTVLLKTEAPPEAGKFYQISCDGVWSEGREPVRNPSALFIFQPAKQAL